MPQKQLSLAAIGCGNRSQIYMSLAAQRPELYKLVAAADPRPSAVERIKQQSNNPDFRSFKDDKELLAEDKLADVLIIGTQDQYHYEPCRKALLKGYDILLEKPIAPCMEEILELQELAEKLGRKLQVCYVLRYTPFYQKVKEIIDSGKIGELVSINAVEGVIPWHQAHSFVRGHWRSASESTPMIIAKCTHDHDILSWLTEAECLSVSSYGSLSHFTKENAPEGATERCTDGCPHAETCHYSALKYADEHRFPWLSQIYENWENANKEEIIDWVSKNNYSRCVYFSDNDVVDRQVVNMEFSAGLTATLTMTAFDIGRQLEIFGTKGVLRGGHAIKELTGSDIIVKPFEGEDEKHTIELDPNDHHMGGDEGIMNALYEEMAGEKSVPVSSYIQSHVMSYAAEESRITGQSINLREFKQQFSKKEEA